MQFIEIIGHGGKIKTIHDLFNFLDSILELVREDVYKIAKSKGIFFSDFDFTYADAVEMLKSQLQKTHLKGISKFLGCENITNAISWLIARLLNNMRNITTNPKFKRFCVPYFGQFHENIKSVNDHETVLELMELEKFDRDTLKKGLQTICGNLIFEEDFDIEYFCEKFGFEVSEIVDTQTINFQKYKKEQIENGNSQLAFIFESEVA